MKQLSVLLCLALLCFSCGGSKKSITVKADRNAAPTAAGTANEITIEAGDEPSSSDSFLDDDSNRDSYNRDLAGNIVGTALSFNGTRYKYGGTSKKGMDCSGLIFTAFGENEISLERTSSLMAKQGRAVAIKEVQKGDLLFFTTGNNKNRINHVGLVVKVDGNEIRFIHSTTSRGVLVSSLNEGYWNYAFDHARRIL